MLKSLMVFYFLLLATSSMAQGVNVSGKVVNSEGQPVSGASVEIRLKGLRVMSGADGSFSFVGATHVFESNENNILNQRPKIKLHNGLLSLQLSSQNNVSIKAFSLAGVALFQIDKTLSSGTHSILVPNKGNGVQIYQVKIGAHKFVLKGYASQVYDSGVPFDDGFDKVMANQKRKPNRASGFPAVISVTASGYIDSHISVKGAEVNDIEVTMQAGNCGNLPNLAVDYESLTGPASSEDFGFDNQGNLLSTDNSDIFKTTFDGSSQLFLPNAVNSASGTAILPNGDIVIADPDNGAVVRITPNGGKEPISSNFSYPNGVTVDLQGFVFVSDQDEGTVQRINPETKEQTLIASDLYNPNGVSFSPDYRYLYVVSFGGGTVHRIQFDDNRNPVGEPLLYASDFGEAVDEEFYESGSFDGAGVDACGNVYITQYGASIVWVVKVNKQAEKVIDLSHETDWIPNLHWGSGIGGWNANILYVIDRYVNRVFALEVGVKGKPMPQF